MKSVLIIDDEEEVGHALRRVLERARFAVSTAGGGPEGLALLDEHVPDLVITDIIMPKMHGIDLIRAIRARHPATRIVAISGGGNFGPLQYQPEAITTSAYLAAATEAGADAVLTKPFDKDALLEVVGRLLNR
jgi:YesN/AraC family two-component response regulator